MKEFPIPATQTISLDEASFILSGTLHPHHRDDPKVLKFITSYLSCRDINQASLSAGIHPNTGKSLRSKRDISECIGKLTELSVIKYGFDADDLVEKVKEIVNVDLSEFENPDGSYKTHLSQLTPETRRAIKKFKCKNIYGEDPNGLPIVTGQLIEVELWDKMKSIELLGREKNIFKETKKLEHDVTTNMAELLLASKERAEEHNQARLASRDVKALPDIVIKNNRE